MISIQLDEIAKQECEADKTLCFMSIPIWKFILLCILTLGLYVIVWYYKYWGIIRDNYKIKINAVFRTFFIIFTCHMLFTIINKYLKRFFMSISPLLMTIVLVIGNFLSVIDDGIIGFCIYLLIFIPSLNIQTKINKINHEYFPNAEKSFWTCKTTLYVLLFWIILFVGLIIYSGIPYYKG